MGDDKTGSSGSFTGSYHGVLGHVVTCGRAGLEQKISLQEKSYYTTLAEFMPPKPWET